MRCTNDRLKPFKNSPRTSEAPPSTSCITLKTRQVLSQAHDSAHQAIGKTNYQRRLASKLPIQGPLFALHTCPGFRSHSRFENSGGTVVGQVPSGRCKHRMLHSPWQCSAPPVARVICLVPDHHSGRRCTQEHASLRYADFWKLLVGDRQKTSDVSVTVPGRECSLRYAAVKLDRVVASNTKKGSVTRRKEGNFARKKEQSQGNN
ncbi:hypothetical protein CC80DRAFT_488769 [Byssothecium circinans]|uniref:Uncharacterized protein n=1 Tax=Byssothecium circinans TaxID=147558 RepID=A0A6A5U9W2_9PLEO|nr:hypothetical protein CC80DRAFT_488769 [Byssothecium circinans]